MTEEEKYTDKMIRELLVDTELKEAPAGLNQRIMQEIMSLEQNSKRFPHTLYSAWILLIIAVALLPFLMKLLSEFLLNIEIKGTSISIIPATSYYFAFLVLISASLLLIAEQLIKISFQKKKRLSI